MFKKNHKFGSALVTKMLSFSVLSIGAILLLSSTVSSARDVSAPATSSTAAIFQASKDTDNATLLNTPLDRSAFQNEMKKPQGRIDTILAQLSSEQHLHGSQAAAAFASSKMLEMKDGLVQVEIKASTGHEAAIAAAIESNGGKVDSRYSELVLARVPVDQLNDYAASEDIVTMKPPTQFRAMTTSEGVHETNADVWQGAGMNGAGVKIGIIDVGFSGYTSMLGTELPSSVTTWGGCSCGTENGGDLHGAAVAEVIHDEAPGANLYLARIATTADFGNAKNWMISQGVDVINMSAGHAGGPLNGTGDDNVIVDDAVNHGIFWANAAGNARQLHWKGNFTDPDNDKFLEWDNRTYEFNIFGAYYGQPIEGVLSWDDSWTNASQDYDMELGYWTGTSWILVMGSYDLQNGASGTEPSEHIGVYAPYTGVYGWVISKWSATRNNVDFDLTTPFTLLDDSSNPYPHFYSHERSLTIPADNKSNGFMAAGAHGRAPGYTEEYYSSEGPTRDNRTAPEINAPSSVTNSRYGVFSGTSSSSPHVAAAAALVKQLCPGCTPAQIESYLKANAKDLGAAGPDNAYGWGRLWLPSLEQTPPVTTNNAPATWQKTNFTVTFTCTDPGSGCKETHYRVDSGADQTGSSVTISTEGDHVITYYSKDNLNNVEAGKTVHAMLDKTASSVTSVKPTGTVNGAIQNIEANLSDAGGSGINASSANIKVDGGAALTNCTTTATHLSCLAPNLAAGAHSISAGISDNAGNTASAAGSFTVNLAYSPRDYYWTWYDNFYMKNWVLMANPSGASSILKFDLSIAGQPQNLAPFSFNGFATAEVPAGKTLAPKIDGLIGGPVKATSNTGGRAIVSQRSLQGNSLEEVLGVDATKLSDHFYWTWYDQLSPGYRNWILIANPSASETVRAEININGSLMQNKLDPAAPDYNQYYFEIAPGKNALPTFQGVMGGPVEVKAYLKGGSWPTNKRNVIASQRVLSNNGTAFNEVPGIPANELSSSYEWTWYDGQSSGFRNWILVANPNGNDVTYQVKIAGALMPCHGTAPGTADAVSTSCTLTPGQNETPQYPGTMNGPVEVISTGGNIIASQRITAGPSFEEVPGYPAAALTNDYHWTWYDGQSAGARNWIMIANTGSSQVTYQIKIAGQIMATSSANPGVIPAGGKVVPEFPGTMNGPVEVISTGGNIMVSQRALWNGYFNEVLGTVLT